MVELSSHLLVDIEQTVYAGSTCIGFSAVVFTCHLVFISIILGNAKFSSSITLPADHTGTSTKNLEVTIFCYVLLMLQNINSRKLKKFLNMMNLNL